MCAVGGNRLRQEVPHLAASASPPGCARRSGSSDLAESYSNVLLHRPSDAGRGGWASSGLDATAMRVGFESTAEFFANG